MTDSENRKLKGMYSSMISRCYGMPKSLFSGYYNYGGRGITVCDEWRNNKHAYIDFIYNLSDGDISKLGAGPDQLTVDRINNDGNYEPSNCRWATPTEQANNKRIQKNSPFKISGVNKQGNGYQVFFGRKYLGYSIDFFEACCMRKSHDSQLNESMVKGRE